MKMKAAVVRQATDPYKFEEVELAAPKNDEVLVRITASGLCHTDEFGRTLGMSPIVLGHEGAGIIEKLGENVKDFAVGDHVAFSYAFCGHCKSCVQGRPQYCEWSEQAVAKRSAGSNVFWSIIICSVCYDQRRKHRKNR